MEGPATGFEGFGSLGTSRGGREGRRRTQVEMDQLFETHRSSRRGRTMDLPSGDRREPELSEASADRAARPPRATLRTALALRSFVNHPVTQFVVGLILIASGLIEAYDTV